MVKDPKFHCAGCCGLNLDGLKGNACKWTLSLTEEQREKTTGPQPGPDLIRDEDGPGVSDPPLGAAADAPSDPGPDLDSSEPIFVHPVSASCPRTRFCRRHPGPYLDRKETLYLAPETLKETDALPMPPKRPKRI